ncbi:hypothetical protein SS1G_00983 [Sclerotinia sclerotiorum 1980 UF-70]|uniref:Uncharacterized protein n=1 Tax=Sclerotinia sclerotiorum (strain ATCC 18683 / 1980 / Ss-1) TaxID=665079 RepID=A7E6Q8_SCLS1|nr:hypothetical protein SS1G_00983 [Sclerotinia sclerotiorum 1980 UF-70]EDN91580.1 hypothetical protein SS1G_00983 [Sclerotinia sclerotiorum 1980 UF-70]
MAPSSTLKPPAPSRPGIRRLSSMTTNETEVKAGGPVVVVPDRMMREPLSRGTSYQGGNFAASLENARNELNSKNLEEEEETASSSADSPSTPLTPADIPTADSFAFAFDIDGVLIPERCIDLSRQLDIEVSPSQFICGHTPMREMVEKYETVLVIGGEGEKCRQVAEGYGFRDVITPGDIIKHNEHTTPFRKLTSEELKNSRGGRDYSKTKIEAIFVFADSRDWASDVQIMLDLAMSKGGYIGTLSETFDEGPPIYFSHSDIVWSAAHENVRLGMGALRKMTEMLFKDLTKGKELETIAFGKPQIGTFEFATRLLQQWRKDEHRCNRPPETVYFVGDTPESDIKGTNQFNEKAKNEWYSILVRTGVFQEGTEPAYKPRVTVDTVLDAVKHGIEREFNKKMKENNPRGLPLNTLSGLSLDGKPIIARQPKILELSSQVVSETGTPEATD